MSVFNLLLDIDWEIPRGYTSVNDDSRRNMKLVFQFLLSSKGKLKTSVVARG